MDPEIQTMLEERLAALPERLREFIQRPTTKASIRIIGEKHNLTSDKFITLENEVMLTLLAFESLEQFDERLMAELLIPGSMATSIAKDLEEMVFVEVRDELERISKAQDVEEPTQEEPTAARVTAPAVAMSQTPRPQQDVIPVKPLADIPRYVKDDPYREPPK